MISLLWHVHILNVEQRREGTEGVLNNYRV